MSNVITRIFTETLTVLYQSFWSAILITALLMVVYMYADKHGGLKATLTDWMHAFKFSINFRRIFVLCLCVSFILVSTLLNRTYWSNPLSKVLGSWSLFNSEGVLNIDPIKNTVLFIPFAISLFWALKSKVLKVMNLGIVLWTATKYSFIFSALIEMLQLLLCLGTFQLSDLFYNTLGGFIGGLIYWIGWKVKHRGEKNQMKEEKKILPELQGVKYLLKFGEKEHIDKFAKGSLFCSNAVTFWGIEDDKKIKGQGDHLEGSAVIYSQNAKFYSNETNELMFEIPIQVKFNMRIDPAKHIPVFCMFAVHDDECDGEKIKLSEESKNIIRSHFPKADTVAIIRNPSQFVNDVVETIGTEIKYDCVHYFHIDEGYPTEDGKTALDWEFFQFLNGNNPPVKPGERQSFKAKDAYRTLFCKDVFFQGEKEFRFVLPDKRIDEGTPYPVTLTETIQTMDLDDFLGQDVVRV